MQLGPTNSFAIDAAFTHSDLDVEKCANLIRFPVLYSWKCGQRIGGLTKRSGYWRARVSEGSTESDFQRGLQELLDGLEPAAPFLLDLKRLEAKLEVLFHFNLQQDVGKLLDFELSPKFLQLIAMKGFSVNVQCFYTAELVE
jgi:hypothetical protein